MVDSEAVALRKIMEAPKYDRLDLNEMSLKSDKKIFLPKSPENYSIHNCTGACNAYHLKCS